MLYVLLVALINLAAGFAVAVQLSRIQRRRSDVAWDEPAAGLSVPDVAAEVDAAPPASDAVRLDMDLLSAAIGDSDDAPVLPPPDAASPETIDIAPTETTADKPEVLQYSKSVEELQNQLVEYEAQIEKIDGRVRSGGDLTDPRDLGSCVASVLEVNALHQKQRQVIYDALEPVSIGVEEIGPSLARIQTAYMEQTAQIRATKETLEMLDWRAHPADGRKQILAETTRLLGAADRLRDALQETAPAAPAPPGESAAPAAGPRGRLDRLTGIVDRAGCEAELADWWDRDPHRIRHLSVALIDLDHFSRFNEQHGREAGNRLLGALGRLIAADQPERRLAARISGQRFLLLMPEEDIRDATSAAERIRQAIELSTVRIQGTEVRVSVSCAVTAAASDDTQESLFSRAEKTLLEAKRYGRNRTFIHEGKYPTPVVPPNLALEERSIDL